MVKNKGSRIDKHTRTGHHRSNSPGLFWEGSRRVPVNDRPDGWREVVRKQREEKELSRSDRGWDLPNMGALYEFFKESLSKIFLKDEHAQIDNNENEAKEGSLDRNNKEVKHIEKSSKEESVTAVSGCMQYFRNMLEKQAETSKEQSLISR